jgi:hypothetical protein
MDTRTLALDMLLRFQRAKQMTDLQLSDYAQEVAEEIEELIIQEKKGMLNIREVKNGN